MQVARFRAHHCPGDPSGGIQEASDVAEKRRERKRLQNRVNQRAKRLREKDKHDSAAGGRKKQPFSVSRWRLDEEEAGNAPSQQDLVLSHQCQNIISSKGTDDSPLQSKTRLQQHEIPCYALATTAMKDTFTPATAATTFTTPSLPADSLIRLVHYNVARGLYDNKSALDVLTLCFSPGSRIVMSIMTVEGFGASLTMEPAAPQLPACLRPTQLQRRVAHSIWIKLLPFPRMRDNLIGREGEFSHRDFATDVIGDSFGYASWFPHSNMSRDLAAAMAPGVVTVLGEEDEMGIANEPQGIILWGEPYLPASWEATPGFLRKWWWAVEGCDELILSTNRWRDIRGENPLQLGTGRGRVFDRGLVLWI